MAQTKKSRVSRRPESRKAKKQRTRRHLSKWGGDQPLEYRDLPMAPGTMPFDGGVRKKATLLEMRPEKSKIPNSMKPEKVDLEDYSLDQA